MSDETAKMTDVMQVDTHHPHSPPTISDTRGQPIDLSPLHTLLARIEAKYHPEQIWLFGSRARGEAREYSDWDLLVVVPDDIDEDELDVTVTWALQRNSGVRADVIACHASDFATARNTVNTLAYEAAHAGVRIDEP